MVNQFSNPYTSNFAPSGFAQQDQQGLMPVFQNTNAQQQYLANQLREQHQMSQPRQQQSGGGMGGMNPMSMANMLRNKPAPQPSDSNGAPVYDYSQPYNSSQYTGIDSWLANGGGQGYDSSGFAMNDYLGNLGLDSGGSFSGAGDFSLGSIGDSLGGAGDWFSGLGDWFGGLFSGSGALAGAGETAAEVAPAAAAAA
jgi:hypothetical protein